MWFSYIQHFDFHTKCPFSVQKLARKQEKAQPAWKKGDSFCKILMINKHKREYFINLPEDNT